jgi:hypothetical protein
LCVVVQLLRSCKWTYVLPLAVNILQQIILLLGFNTRMLTNTHMTIL